MESFGIAFGSVIIYSDWWEIYSYGEIGRAKI